jgi:hypothetical protein
LIPDQAVEMRRRALRRPPASNSRRSPAWAAGASPAASAMPRRRSGPTRWSPRLGPDRGARWLTGIHVRRCEGSFSFPVALLAKHL